MDELKARRVVDALRERDTDGTAGLGAQPAHRQAARHRPLAPLPPAPQKAACSAASSTASATGRPGSLLEEANGGECPLVDVADDLFFAGVVLHHVLASFGWA